MIKLDTVLQRALGRAPRPGSNEGNEKMCNRQDQLLIDKEHVL